MHDKHLSLRRAANMRLAELRRLDNIDYKTIGKALGVNGNAVSQSEGCDEWHVGTLMRRSIAQGHRMAIHLGGLPDVSDDPTVAMQKQLAAVDVGYYGPMLRAQLAAAHRIAWTRSSAAVLAEMCGYEGVEAYWNALDAWRDPRMSTIQRMADAIGVAVTVTFDGDRILPLVLGGAC